jgi:putative thioredoxin
VASNEKDSEACYFLAAHLMVSDDVEAAIDQLLTVVRTDRQYNEDAARLLLIQIFDRLGNDDPRARAGRKQLAALLMV